MKRKSYAAKITAFTLIELLIVIAIIAILAAILFPVFASAREKARQTACVSDLKQIGLAVAQYEQDSDELPPNGWQDTGCGWAGQIYAYVKSTKVFICPSDPSSMPACSYLYNSNLITGASTSWSGVALSQMTQPSRTIMLCEENGSGQGASIQWTPATELGYQQLGIASNQGTHMSPTGYLLGGNYDPYGAGGGDSSGASVMRYATGVVLGANTTLSYGAQHFTGVLGIHQGGACYLFADNHAKWLMPSQVTGGYNNNPSSGNPCKYGSANAWNAASVTCNVVSGTMSYL